MILENFPEIQSLEPESQLELAAELIERATEGSDTEIVAALNARIEEHKKNPHKVSTFAEIKARILKAS